MNDDLIKLKLKHLKLMNKKQLIDEILELEGKFNRVLLDKKDELRILKNKISRIKEGNYFITKDELRKEQVRLAGYYCNQKKMIERKLGINFDNYL